MSVMDQHAERDQKQVAAANRRTIFIIVMVALAFYLGSFVLVAR